MFKYLEDFILNLNFLNGKIVANTQYSSSSFDTTRFSPVDKKYKSLNQKRFFVVLRICKYSNKQSRKTSFNQIIKSPWDIENKQNRLDLREVIPALDGSMSFSLNKPSNSLISTDSSYQQNYKNIYSIQNPKSNEEEVESEENWDDDDFFQEEEEFTENTNISLPYNISMGIKEKQILKDIFHKNNVELK